MGLLNKRGLLNAALRQIMQLFFYQFIHLFFYQVSVLLFGLQSDVIQK